MFKVDQGTHFGTWDDPTSLWMYHGIMHLLKTVVTVPPGAHVGDYGGANGLICDWFDRVTTIDLDPTKEPDVVDDVRHHRGVYDVVFMRYLLHYLTDDDVMQTMRCINAPRAIVVQFVNENLSAKYANSVGEVKYFRTAKQLEALLPTGAKLVASAKYQVSSEFYRNRLGLEGAIPHEEAINIYDIDLTKRPRYSYV